MNYVLDLAVYFGVGGLSLTIMAAMVAAPLALLALLIDRVAGK